MSEPTKEQIQEAVDRERQKLRDFEDQMKSDRAIIQGLLKVYEKWVEDNSLTEITVAELKALLRYVLSLPTGVDE